MTSTIKPSPRPTAIDRRAAEFTATFFGEVVWSSNDPESPRTIFRVNARGQSHACIANVLPEQLEDEQTYRFLGRWEESKYGPQFQVSTHIVDVPASPAGVIKYLTTFAPSLGKAAATKLLARYGADAVAVLREEPARVAEDKILLLADAQHAAGELATRVATERTKLDLFGLLDRRGFYRTIYDAVIAKWGVNAPATIRRDPFKLLTARMPGAGFKRSDKLWYDLGLPRDALKRQTICGWNALQQDRTGHTWFRESEVRDKIEESIRGDGCDPARAITLGVRAGWFARHVDDAGHTWLAEADKARAERRIAHQAEALMAGRVIWPIDLPVSVTDGDGLPSEHQRTTALQAIASPVGILAGGPGTGKTHTLAFILRELLRTHSLDEIAVCAPTGKAAVRATQSLERIGLGAMRATTIHSLLEIGHNGHDGDGWGFQRNKNNPLDKRFVIVDECFVSGTLVNTPYGNKEIQSLLVGDKVFNATGVGTVLATKKREASHVVRITAGKASFICSENHPFFTSRGWVRAIDLGSNDSLVQTETAMRLLRKGNCSKEFKRGVGSFLHDCLLNEMVDAIPGTESETLYSRSSRPSRRWPVAIPTIRNTGSERANGPNSPSKSYEESQLKIAMFATAPRDWIQTIDSRRQRTGTNCTSETSVVGAGVCVDAGTCDLLRSNPELSNALQGGPRKFKIANSNRNRRVVTLFLEATSKRQEEEQEVDFTRVDRVEVLEQGNPELDQFRDASGKLYLYDLSVSGHPSFSVNDCLVHNCSMVDTGLLACLLDACGLPHTMPAIPAMEIPPGEPVPPRCRRCKRPLTNPDSWVIGHGPECAKLVDPSQYRPVAPIRCDHPVTIPASPAIDSPGVHVLLIGDPGQLPPVNHGRPLMDLLASNRVGYGELVEVRRNAGQIVHACRAIRAGSDFETSQRIDLAAEPPANLKLIETRNERESITAIESVLSSITRWDRVWQTQVIVPLNTKGALSRVELNKRLRKLLNPAGLTLPGLPFSVGDKIVCLRNSWIPEARPQFWRPADAADPIKVADAKSYKKNGDEEQYVANGEIGRVVAIAAGVMILRMDGKLGLIRVPVGKTKASDGDGDAPAGDDSGAGTGQGCCFDHAYALTAHKMQGSESPLVIVMADAAGDMVAGKEWWYTAISRAAQACIVIGSPAVIERQSKRAGLSRRKTFLQELIRFEPKQLEV